MKGYSPSTELLNLYDTAREKPFEFMHSRSFVNINVATGWTTSHGGQFPYENVITLPVDEGDFPITMEYQPTAIIQPNANESCAPSNFPYIETTGRNQVTLYAYSIPSSTSMLPIIVNLTQNGSPYGSTNASAQRSSVEQTMIQLSQNYFLVEANNDILTKEHKLTFTVTAYKGGEEVTISRPDTMPEYGIVDQDGLPILNPRPVHDPNPNENLYPKVLVSGSGTSIQVDITLSKDTIIKNGIAIIQFPVKAGTVFYPRATINAITSKAILEQVDSYDLSFDTLTRSSGGDFYVNDKVLGLNDKWIIKATKRTLNGAVSSVSSGTIIFTNVQTGELYSEKYYSQDLADSKVALGKFDLEDYEVFEEPIIRIDLKVGSKVVASEYIDISVSVFSTSIKPSVQFIRPGLENIRFLSYTLFDNRTIVSKNGILTIYKNYVDPANKLISKYNVNEINYSLIPTESKLEGVKSLVVTFAELIGGEVTQQLVIPVLGGTGGTGEPATLNLSALPAVLIVDVDKDYKLKSDPVSTLKVYRNGNDVTKDFNFAAVSDAEEDFNFTLVENQLTVTEFAAGASQIVGVVITVTNKMNPSIKTIGSLQAVRRMEGEIIDYYTYIRYTSDPVLGTDITESIVGGTKYMGVAVTTTPDAPTDKAEYKWTPVTEDGPAIDSTKVDYAVSHSGTEWPGLESDLWHDFPESLEEGSYLWTRTKTTYTDGETTYAYSVSYIAIDGVDGQTLYTWIKYSDNADGTDLYDVPKASTLYIGIATNKTTATESEEKTDYVWSKFKGDKGDKGENAKLIALSTDTQIFKVSKTGEVTPATATITSELQNVEAEDVKWAYSIDGGDFSEDFGDPEAQYISIIENGLEITGSSMIANTLTVKASVGNLSDTITIAKLTDGTDGTDGSDAYTVLLSNESHTFLGDESKAIDGSTIIDVIAYKGATPIKAEIGDIKDIQDIPEGLEIDVIDVIDDDPIKTQIEVTVSSDLTSPNGTLTIPVIVDEKLFIKTFSFAVSYKGSKGETGKGISFIKEYYLVSPSSDEAEIDDRQWSTDIPIMDAVNKYLWNYEEIHFDDGTSSPTIPVIIGNYSVDGEDGTPGRSLEKVTEYYLASAKSSGVTILAADGTTNTWSTDMQTTSVEEPYLWNYEELTWSDDPKTTHIDPIIIGVHGATGPQGEDAKLITLSTTAQVFKVSGAGTETEMVTPAEITITTALQNTEVSEVSEVPGWIYSINGETFSEAEPAGVSREGNTVTVTGSEMTATTITVKATDGTVSDTLTIAKVFDGKDGSHGEDGADAYTVVLSNESHIFAGDESKALADSTTSSVMAYKGTEEVTATIHRITGQPTGMTTKIFPETETEPAYFTVDVTPDLVTPSGVLTVYLIVDGDRAFTRTFSYAVSYKGSRGPAGPVLIIEAPDGLAFSKNQTKSIRLEVKLMDEDINRIGEYNEPGEIRWERSSSDSAGDILFASTKQGPSIDVGPEFLNVPATYTCFVSKIIRGSGLTTDDGELQGRKRTSDPLEVISVDTYSPVVYTAHVTTSPETSKEIRNIEEIIENIERNSVTTSDFERTQSRIFGSVSELVKTTADLRTREEGMEDVVEKILLKTETLTSELDMTSRRIRGEVNAISNTGDRRYSSLQLEADSIKSEVGAMSKDMSYMSSRITQTADSIRQEVSNIQVGGRNLLLNSNSDEAIILKKQQKTYEITKLWPETEYTVSISGNYQKPVEVWLATLHKAEGEIVETPINDVTDLYVGDLENNKLTFTTPILVMYSALIVYSEDLTLTTIQLEKGNRVTDWTPAPEEQEQRLTNVLQTALGTETNLNNLKTEFQASMRYELKKVDNMAQIIDLGDLDDPGNIYKRGDEIGVLELGDSSDKALKVWIWNERISFLQDSREVAYISNSKLYITDGEFLSSLRLGNFAFTPRDGGLSFGRVE